MIVAMTHIFFLLAVFIYYVLLLLLFVFMTHHIFFTVILSTKTMQNLCKKWLKMRNLVWSYSQKKITWVENSCGNFRLIGIENSTDDCMISSFFRSKVLAINRYCCHIICSAYPPNHVDRLNKTFPLLTSLVYHEIWAIAL